MLCLHASAYAQDCTTYIKGVVVDEQLRTPIVNIPITVTPINKIIYTSDDGSFYLDGLCEGDYTIVIDDQRYKTSNTDVHLGSSLNNLEIVLQARAVTLEEVKIITDKRRKNIGFQKRLDQKTMNVRSNSLAATLSELNGITMQQTGATVAKPVVHGLQGHRLLMIQNGVRQEGQQWGIEHAPEIDPYIADQITVIKGVDELKYGSDAIGGVVMVDPASMLFEPGWKGVVRTAVSVNQPLYLITTLHEFTPKNMHHWSFRVHGTYKRGGNVRTPQYRLNNTALEEKALSFTAAYRRNDFHQELYYSFFDNHIGLFTGSHIGNLTDLLQAISEDKPASEFIGDRSFDIDRPSQTATHHLLKWKGGLHKNGHSIHAQLSAQFNDRKEYDIIRGNSSLPQMVLKIQSYQQTIGWESPLRNGFKTSAGIEVTEQINHYEGRYFIPQFTSFSGGAYMIEKWQHNNWNVSGGLRYDRKNIHTKRMRYGGEELNHSFHYNNYAASLHVQYRIDTTWRMNIGWTSSTRAPYVNELLSDGIHHSSATYEQGDINLKSEKSFYQGIEIGFRKKKWDISVTGYFHVIKDFIFRVPVPDSPVLTISGAFPYLKYQQSDAHLYGIDAEVKHVFSSAMEWKNQFSILYAWDVSDKDWMIGMPPATFQSSLQWNINSFKKLNETYIRLQWEVQAEQKRVPDKAGVRFDYKEPPKGYGLIHFYAGTVVEVKKQPIEIQFFIKNLTNKSYRNYLNTMRYFSDEKGIDAGVEISIPLSKNNK